jgi:hypothetical protein
VLATVIAENAGLIFAKPPPGDAPGDTRSFTIIPSFVPRESAPDGCSGSELVTEMWIERCIAANAIFDPAEMVICKPMPGPFPRPCRLLVT